MAFCLKLVAVLAAASAVGAASTYEPQREISAEEYSDSYQLHQIPLNFQLPREAPAQVPFYSPEPLTELRAPQYAPEPDYYQVPIPAQDLIAPVETIWNPNNDPKFYYEVPAVISKQELPTNSYPKKFNKDIHSKDKPFAAKPKQEIVLQPMDEAEYGQKQKELHKVFQKLAKKENQKLIKAEKESQTV